MPDQDTNTEATETETAEQTVEQQGDPAELGDAGKKALSAERTRASEAEKQAKALQAQLDALNDSKLTETQRLEKQLAELQASYQASQLTAARDRIAVAEQIPPQLVPYISGKDEAELLDSAKALTAALAEAMKPGTPKPDPSQGAKGTSASSSTAQQFASFLESKLS